MSVASLFTAPVGDDMALIPRGPAIAEALHELIEANYERLSRWNPAVVAEPFALEETRARLERQAVAWLAGSLLPVAIAVPHESGGWRLAGTAALSIDAGSRSAEVGYWIDGGLEGRGLVTRTVSALLDHAFGPLGLHRVALATYAANHRSRALAERLGFTREGVLRQVNPTPDGFDDEVIYGLLADEWRGTAGGDQEVRH